MKKQKHLKVRRVGIGRVVIHKSPFAAWLDDQHRALLTYHKGLPNTGPEAKGWSAEDFAFEAHKRGLTGVRVQTVYKRRAGCVPNSEAMDSLRKAFPTIQF